MNILFNSLSLNRIICFKSLVVSGRNICFAFKILTNIPCSDKSQRVNASIGGIVGIQPILQWPKCFLISLTGTGSVCLCVCQG